MQLKTHIQYAYRARYVPTVAQFNAWARAALEGSRQRTLELGIRIVAARESARLNGQYRKQPQATNVLSFPYAKMPLTPQLSYCFLGDLVICAPVVRREARTVGKDLASHWAHMVVHGILHLRGYDHGNPAEAAAMEGFETRILHRLGFADPYA